VIDRKRKGDGIRKILQILSQKGAIGFVMDQSRPGEPKLPFFGKDAKTNTALASLLCKSPAPVLLGYAKRLGVRRHTVVFTPELDLQFSGDKGEDVLSISAQFNQEIELAIRQCPEQYLWLHNRWK
jgi:KDO2-lipid IV(A) lauroyltransferase